MAIGESVVGRSYVIGRQTLLLSLRFNCTSMRPSGKGTNGRFSFLPSPSKVFVLPVLVLLPSHCCSLAWGVLSRTKTFPPAWLAPKENGGRAASRGH